MSYTEEEQIEEQIHFSNIVATFDYYEQHSISANTRRRKDFLRIPEQDRKLLEEIGWKRKLDSVDIAIQANAAFLRKIVADPAIFEGHNDSGEEEGEGEKFSTECATEESSTTAPQASHPHLHSHSHVSPHGHSHDSSSHGHSHAHNHDSPGLHQPHIQPRRSKIRPSEGDMDKLRSSIKQLVRDWAEEGRPERERCYKPMVDALIDYFSATPETERNKVRVLVPGAGLARLALDVARLGFTCQGNEFSHHMLLMSFFILNRTHQLNEHIIYPYIHSFSNTLSEADILRAITIPDVLPSDLPENSDFSLVAGDFEEVYGAGEDDPRGHESQVGKWNAVLTCFFLDTAKNIVNYLRILHRILAPGGVWINLGPLLWHYENNSSGDISIELSLEEMKALVRKMGFNLTNERTIETTYTSDSKSMLGYVYKTEFWVATKIEANSTS